MYTKIAVPGDTRYTLPKVRHLYETCGQSRSLLLGSFEMQGKRETEEITRFRGRCSAADDFTRFTSFSDNRMKPLKIPFAVKNYFPNKACRESPGNWYRLDGTR